MLTTTPDPFITVAQVKTHLKKSGTADDAELQTFVGAACEMIRGLVGEVADVTAVDTRSLRCRRDKLVTEHRPVRSITSITAGGTALDSSTYALANPEGVITGRFSGDVTITYVCGRGPVPDNITLAALELAAHLWRASQNGGAGAPQFGDASDGVQLIGSAFALPIRVRELLGLGKRGTDEPLIG